MDLPVLDTFYPGRLAMGIVSVALPGRNHRAVRSHLPTTGPSVTVALTVGLSNFWIMPLTVLRRFYW